VVRLHLDVYGEEQIDRELLRFSSYVGDPSPAFHKIADDMREDIGHRFEAEGPGWAKLAASTLAAKAAAGLPPEILQATRKLMRSLSQKGAGHVEEVGDDFLRFGSSVPYGKFHQKGTTKMPERKVIDFTEADRRGFVRTLQRYIRTGEV
jgi:phage gpG-like protein